MDLPSHPGTDDTVHDPEPARKMSGGMVVALVVGVTLLVVMVVLHLTGAVGPGGH